MAKSIYDSWTLSEIEQITAGEEDASLKNSGSKNIGSMISNEIKGIGKTFLDAVNVPKAVKSFYQTLKRDNASIESVEQLVRNNASIEEIRGTINNISGAINRTRARNAAQKINPSLKRSELRVNDDYEQNINLGFATYWGKQKKGVNKSQVSSDLLAGVNLFSKLAFGYAAAANPVSLAGTLYGFKKADQGARYLAERSSGMEDILKKYEGQSVALGKRTIHGDELNNVIRNFYAGSYSTIGTAAYFLANGAKALVTGDLSTALIPLLRGGISGLTAKESYNGMKDIRAGRFGEGTMSRMSTAKDLQTLSTALYAASATAHVLPSMTGLFDNLKSGYHGFVAAEILEGETSSHEKNLMPDKIDTKPMDMPTKEKYIGDDKPQDKPYHTSTHETHLEPKMDKDIFEWNARLHPNEPLWQILAKVNTDSDPSKISKDEFQNLSERDRAVYGNLFNFDVGRKGIDIHEANTYLNALKYSHDITPKVHVPHKVRRETHQPAIFEKITSPFTAIGSEIYNSVDSMFKSANDGIERLIKIFPPEVNTETHASTWDKIKEFFTEKYTQIANDGNKFQALDPKYSHIHYVDSNGDGKIDSGEATASLNDYHKAYLHNYRMHQREHISGGDLKIDHDKFIFKFNDPNYIANLDRQDNMPKLGFVPHESDVVVRIFRHGDGTPIAIADLGEKGISDGMIFRNGIHLSEQNVFDGISKGKYFAEASIIDRNGTYGDCPTNKNGFGNDEVFIFDKFDLGRYIPHAPRHHHNPMIHTGSDEGGLRLHHSQGGLIAGSNIHTNGIKDGYVKHENDVSNLINYTSDRGWEGFEGTHPGADLKGKIMVVNSGDHLGIESNNEDHDTSTWIVHDDNSLVYGKQTFGNKLLHVFQPKSHEWDRYKIIEDQSGKKGEILVLDGNNGIYGNNSGHPDEAIFKYHKHPVEGGHKFFGKHHTLLGGVKVDDENDRLNDYHMRTMVSHRDKNIIKYDGINEQNVHVEPMRNSTAYIAGMTTGALGTYGVMSAIGPAEKIVEVPKIMPGLEGSQTGGPGIIGTQ